MSYAPRPNHHHHNHCNHHHHNHCNQRSSDCIYLLIPLVLKYNIFFLKKKKHHNNNYHHTTTTADHRFRTAVLGMVLDAPVVVQRQVQFLVPSCVHSRRLLPDVAALIVDNGSGMFMAGFAGMMQLALCYL